METATSIVVVCRNEALAQCTADRLSTEIGRPRGEYVGYCELHFLASSLNGGPVSIALHLLLQIFLARSIYPKPTRTSFLRRRNHYWLQPTPKNPAAFGLMLPTSLLMMRLWGSKASSSF